MSDELQLFLDEAAEHLDACDRAALALDDGADAGDVSSLLNTLFRGVHTLKGNAGMMGMAATVEVAHVLEHLLDRLRAEGRSPSRDVVDVVFAGLDALRTLVHLAPLGDEGTLDTRDLMRLLRTTAGLAGAADDEAGARYPGWERVESPDREAPEAGIARGELALYALHLQLPEVDWRAPLDHPDLEKLLALGRAVAWCRAEDGGLRVGYVTAATPDLVRAFGPEGLQACEPRPDGRLPAPGGELPAASPDGAPQAPPEAEAPGAPPAEGGETSIRVGITLLDKLMNLVGELVLTRNQVLQVTHRAADATLFTAPVQRLNLITTELQEAVMRTRMQPIGQVWEKFPRLVRDYCRQTGKEIRLEQEGAETELDKSLLESIKDPLTHLVRNAIDHGLEPPRDRAASGKPATGVIRLRARQDGGSIMIEIADDGRGLDHAKIRAKAQAAGLATSDALARMTEAELAQLVFHPGFSTADAVTDISGRGVGMDVVRNDVERVGGSVELTSSPGRGTTAHLKIPLTLAVIPALVIMMGRERFAIPQGGVLEVVRTGDGLQRVENFRGARVYRLREALVPVIDLREALGLGEAGDAVEGHLVILQAGSQVFGLAVDEIGDTEEIVVKPLHRLLQALPAFSGVTIMGDGRPCMILDVSGLAACGNLDAAAAASEADGGGTHASEGHRLLIVAIGPRQFAIPMALVTRLEDFAARALEQVGSRTVVQYGEHLLTLIDPTGLLGMPPLEATETAPVVVFGLDRRVVGVRVSAIRDIVEEAATLHPARGIAGVAGAIVVEGKTTEVLDVQAVIDAALPGWFAAGAHAGQPDVEVHA